MDDMNRFLAELQRNQQTQSMLAQSQPLQDLAPPLEAQWDQSNQVPAGHVQPQSLATQRPHRNVQPPVLYGVSSVPQSFMYNQPHQNQQQQQHNSLANSAPQQSFPQQTIAALPTSGPTGARSVSRFSNEQTAEMRTMFDRNHNPDREAMEFLARNIGLTYEQVRKWMSRERSKLKESGVAVQSNNNTSTFPRASSIASDESAADANSTTSAGAPPPLNTTPTTPALSETVTSAAPAQITFDDIDFEDPAYVIKYLRFLSTAQTVVEKRLRLDLSEEEVSPEFYEAFAQTKEFRGLILLKKWLLEAKDAAEWELVKDVLNLLEKLPVSVEGLAVTKLGRVVAGLGKVENADGSVKELSAKVTKIWTDVVAKQNAPKSTPEPEPAPAPVPAPAAPKTITLEERRRAQKEKEDAIAAEQKAKADALLAKIKTSAPSTTTPAEPSPTSTSATLATEPKFASFSYRKKAAPEPTPPEKEATPEPPAPVVLNEHGVKSILSSTVTPDVDPLHPRKKRKAVTFAAELVKTRYFNIDDDVMAAGDRHFKNKSARDSERGEGRIAFGSGVGGSGGAREVKANGEWRQLRLMAMSVHLPVTETPETKNQEDRERNVMSVTYYEDSEIPANPTDLDEDYGEDDDMRVEPREVIMIPLDDPADVPAQAVTVAPLLSGLGGLSALFSGNQQPQTTPTTSVSVLGLLSSLQQQQQQPPKADVSNLLRSLGVAPPTAPTPPTQFPSFLQQPQPVTTAPSSLPSFLQQPNQTSAVVGGVPPQLVNLLSKLAPQTPQQHQQPTNFGFPLAMPPPPPPAVAQNFNNSASVAPGIAAFLQNLQQTQQQQSQAPQPQQYPFQQAQQQQQPAPALLAGLAAFQQQANMYNSANKHPRQDDDMDEWNRNKRVASDFSRQGQPLPSQQQQFGRGGSFSGRGRGGFTKNREDIKPKGKCHYWSRGNCQYGDKCFNIHEGEGGSTRNF